MYVCIHENFVGKGVPWLSSKRLCHRVAREKKRGGTVPEATECTYHDLLRLSWTGHKIFSKLFHYSIIILHCNRLCCMKMHACGACTRGYSKREVRQHTPLLQRAPQLQLDISTVVGWTTGDIARVTSVQGIRSNKWGCVMCNLSNIKHGPLRTFKSSKKHAFHRLTYSDGNE